MKIPFLEFYIVKYEEENVTKYNWQKNHSLCYDFTVSFLFMSFYPSKLKGDILYVGSRTNGWQWLIFIVKTDCVERFWIFNCEQILVFFTMNVFFAILRSRFQLSYFSHTLRRSFQSKKISVKRRTFAKHNIANCKCRACLIPN